MSDSESDCEVTTVIKIPEKSRAVYESLYNKFEEWCKKRNVQWIDEPMLLGYFQEMVATQKPSTAWSHYSMLKATLMEKKNIDISGFSTLTSLLKGHGRGYKPKKSRVFTKYQTDLFLREAEDETYLVMKVSP